MSTNRWITIELITTVIVIVILLVIYFAGRR